MATSPDAVRAQLAVVTAAATSEITAAASQVALEQQAIAALVAAGLIVPDFYDAAGSLALAWYDELRDESRPTSTYTPTIIGDPTTDWIEREAAKFQKSLEVDLEREMALMVDEIARLAEKEVARGYRDSILGNARSDEDAIGWSRITRPGACRFCLMLASNGVFYRSESSARFGAHTDCHCAAQPAFRNGERGPEADVVQYLASQKRRTPAQRARVRRYLNENYPDARG